MIQRIVHFAGDTFAEVAQYVDQTGVAKSLAGVIVEARIQIDGLPPVPLDITVLNEAEGRYQIGKVAAQTEGWLPGLWPLQISYVGVTRETDPAVLIEVKEAI